MDNGYNVRITDHDKKLSVGFNTPNIESIGPSFNELIKIINFETNCSNKDRSLEIMKEIYIRLYGNGQIKNNQ